MGYKKRHIDRDIFYQWANNLLASDYLFVLDICIEKQPYQPKINLFIDSEHYNVTASLCGKIAYKLRFLAAAYGLCHKDTEVEVSTPGLDQPIKDIRQMPKNLGKALLIITKENKTIKGCFKGINGNEFIIKPTTKNTIPSKGGYYAIKWDDIESLYIVPSLKRKPLTKFL